jgi:hypothetical protein
MGGNTASTDQQHKTSSEDKPKLGFPYETPYQQALRERNGSPIPLETPERTARVERLRREQAAWLTKLQAESVEEEARDPEGYWRRRD